MPLRRGHVIRRISIYIIRQSAMQCGNGPWECDGIGMSKAIHSQSLVIGRTQTRVMRLCRQELHIVSNVLRTFSDSE